MRRNGWWGADFAAKGKTWVLTIQSGPPIYGKPR